MPFSNGRDLRSCPLDRGQASRMGASRSAAWLAGLGHPERGEDLIARIDGALERARGIVPGKRSILVYERGGWGLAAPVRPLANSWPIWASPFIRRRSDCQPAGPARLETIVVTPPDFLLVDADSGRARDNGTALFAHPALADAVPPERRLAVPARLTICGGPATPAAIDAAESRGSGQGTVRGLDHSSCSCRAGAGLRRIGQPAATKTTASQASATTPIQAALSVPKASPERGRGYDAVPDLVRDQDEGRHRLPDRSTERSVSGSGSRSAQNDVGEPERQAIDQHGFARSGQVAKGVASSSGASIVSP